CRFRARIRRGAECRGGPARPARLRAVGGRFLMALTLPPRIWRTLLWGVLVVSLGLNAFFIGASVTDMIRFRHGGDKGPRIIRTELRWLKDRLSPDAVETIEGQLESLKPDIV